MKSALGELAFKMGWKKNHTAHLWGKDWAITVKAQAYFEQDGLTKAQEEALGAFDQKQAVLLHKIEGALEQQYGLNTAQLRFRPTLLLFKRNGDCALLLDDEQDADGGLAVTLFPQVGLVSQDDYL